MRSARATCFVYWLWLALNQGLPSLGLVKQQKLRSCHQKKAESRVWCEGAYSTDKLEILNHQHLDSSIAWWWWWTRCSSEPIDGGWQNGILYSNTCRVMCSEDKWLVIMVVTAVEDPDQKPGTDFPMHSWLQLYLPLSHCWYHKWISCCESCCCHYSYCWRQGRPSLCWNVRVKWGCYCPHN